MNTPPTPQDARSFALQAHGDQTYGSHPYHVHLDAVANLLQPYGDDAQILAFLHDTVEDTPTTLDDIERLFGTRIAQCVDLLTDQPGPNRKTRKAATYARLQSLQNPQLLLALTVKTADRLANVQACVRDNNTRLLHMYAKEHPTFTQAAYRPGLCDPLWDTLHPLIPTLNP